MTGRQERLIRKAERFLEAGEPIPLDLADTLMDAGIIVSMLEARFNAYAHV
jgi:hypothetical protein